MPPRLSTGVRLLLLGLLAFSACTSGTRALPASPPVPVAPSDAGGVALSPSPPAEAASVAVSPPPPVKAPTWEGPRPSSFRPCPRKAVGGCDYGEGCDYTSYDILCVADSCDFPQTGDQRCHRICDDGVCGQGETCVRRTVGVSDTGEGQLPLCLCAGKDCPERGPGGIPWPAEGGLAPWRQERSMPADLYYHAAVATQDRLFVSGGLHIQEISGSGASLDLSAKVFSAPLQADGGLGEWTESGTLPVPVMHHGMAVVAGRLFIAGGQRLSEFTAKVFSAPIREDGTLGPWRKEAPLPKPRAWHSLVASGEELWVIAGTLDKAYFTRGTRQLWRAKVATDSGARVSRWEALEAPFAPHYDQGVALSKGRLYAVDVRGQLSSVALDAGRDWRVEPSPPWKGHVNFGSSGLHLVRFVALPDTLLLLMPRGLTLTASLQPDGTVKDWRQASRLHHLVSGFATASSPNGRVYVLGGTTSAPTMQRNPEVWSTTRVAP